MSRFRCRSSFHAMKYPIVVAVPVLVASLSHGAVVHYSDGLDHTLPGDVAFTNGDAVEVIGTGTRAFIADGAVLSGTTTDRGFNVAAIESRLGTSIHQSGGLVEGISYNPVRGQSGSGFDRGSEGVEVRGGSYYATGGRVLGGSVTGTDIRNVDGGPGLGFYDETAVGQLSNVEIIGGSVSTNRPSGNAFADGGSAVVGGGGTLDILSGTYIGGDASTNISNGDYSSADGGHAINWIGENLDIHGGSFTGGSSTNTTTPRNSNGGSAAFIVGLPGDGQTAISGGVFQGGNADGIAGSGVELESFAFHKVAISGGNFTGGNGGIDDGSGILVDVILIQPGIFDLEISGGTFTGHYGLDSQPIIAQIPDIDPSFVITGGDFIGLSGTDLSLTGGLGIDIFGEAFYLDGQVIEFGNIAAESGTLTGLLADGSSFDWTFVRDTNSPINLVEIPESSSLALVAMGALALVRRRQR